MDQIKEEKIEREVKQIKSLKQLEGLRVKYLGRNGLINQLVGRLRNQKIENRKILGQRINKLKRQLEELIINQRKELEKGKIEPERKETGKKTYALQKFGHLHPITIVSNEINNLFRSLGFSIYYGPEIETDEYCFERLNVPKNHPARDLQDTIYIKEPEILLTSQLSSVEVHLLENETPPFKAAFPGRIYRNEKVTKKNHFIFHQYQGVAVDKNINLKNLIGVFDKMFKFLYGQAVTVRYRCKYYPEVEPGLGLDLQCFACHGVGCSLCVGLGWIEMGGAGIIHPLVLEKSGINPKKWRGFAFGLGLDRWVMAKYNIKDIRTLLGGNLAYKPNRR